MMAAIFTKKVSPCLSLSKYCRAGVVCSRSKASSTVTAVDYDEKQGGSSSSSNDEHLSRARRLKESPGAVRRTRTHLDTVIRDRGIALIRNPHTNKVSELELERCFFPVLFSECVLTSELQLYNTNTMFRHGSNKCNM